VVEVEDNNSSWWHQQVGNIQDWDRSSSLVRSRTENNRTLVVVVVAAEEEVCNS